MVKVAVVGVTGVLGKHVLNALVSDPFRSDVTLPIVAITRDASQKQSTDEIKYVEASLDDPQALAAAFKGVASVVSLTNKDIDVRALVDGAIQAGVKLFLPSEFGSDHRFSRFRNTFAVKRHNAFYARSKGLRTVCLQTGKFMELALREPLINGIDKEACSYTPIDGGGQKEAYTSLKDTSLCIASLLTHPKPEELPDNVFVQGDFKSSNDMVDIWEKYNGVVLRVLPPVDKDTCIDNAVRADMNTSPTMADFFLVIQAEAIMPYKAMDFTDKLGMDLVSPKIQWQKLEDLARVMYTE